MATKQQNDTLQLWLRLSLKLNPNSVMKMKQLYEQYCADAPVIYRITGELSPIPVRPKAFATLIKKYAQSTEISGEVAFYYLRASMVHGWEYVSILKNEQVRQLNDQTQVKDSVSVNG